MGGLDIAVFVGFMLFVVAVALWKGRGSSGEGGEGAQDFFLAGRGLSWWLVGFSLIAANISTEQFVGMSGAAASHVGLAIASYEWMASVTLVVVAFAFLPYFLRVGIYTMPEFLEYRFNASARLVMAALTIAIYLLLLGAVTYSGALTVQTLGESFDTKIPLWQPSLFIALIAMIYVVAGGLKASVWADLVQGTALILGGAVLMYLAFDKLGDVEQAATIVDSGTGEVQTIALDPEQGALARFTKLNSGQLNMFLPSTDNVLPWTALLLGLWIPNFYYWGLNQYITQRTLGSSSLPQGQKGIVFAAYLKLIIPFVVVIPGIIAFNLFHDDMRIAARKDAAKAMALYLKANPDTQYVTTSDAPDGSAVASHAGPEYLLALYGSPEAMAEVKEANPYVLPIVQSDFDALSPGKFQVFNDVEDHAWRHINPDLAQEVETYNQGVLAQAKDAGESPASQALVAYKYDTALGHLLGMLPQYPGLFGFVLAALLGAVISSLAAMLNAASSIFTLDLCHKWLLPGAGEKTLVSIGRACVVVCACVACWLSTKLGDPNISNPIFTIIQKGQGLLSPGVLALFAFGLVFRRAPRSCGVVALVVNILCYGGFWFLSETTDLLSGIG
ncbi:MAG: sodium/solute symporter, partial [Planctomycetales bacterium]|nr:sodium/solute symporter [Planctomycetales bacterium]